MKKTHLYTIHEAKSSLSKLIQQALRGEEVIIAKRDIPLVQLNIIQDNKVRLGRFVGKVTIEEGFDDPIADFKDYI